MGWDAFATGTGGVGVDRLAGEVPGLAPAFKAAADGVRLQVGAVDGLLKDGGLDCSICAQALELATGRDCWDENGWSAADVRRLAAAANWDFPAEAVARGASRNWADAAPWAKASARAFLETCAALGLGIRFTW